MTTWNIRKKIWEWKMETYAEVREGDGGALGAPVLGLIELAHDPVTHHAALVVRQVDLTLAGAVVRDATAHPQIELMLGIVGTD